MQLIDKEVKAADALKSKGKLPEARKLYVACAEALNKVKLETSDDPTF
jgi:hypothetical protein